MRSKKVNAKAPTTWDEFFKTADALQKKPASSPSPSAASRGKKQNYSKPWRWASAVRTSTKKSLCKAGPIGAERPDHDQSAGILSQSEGYTDKANAGRDWNLATAMVINGKAAMQFMGDWAKGEFSVAGKRAGVDYLCVAAPGSAGAYTFNVDSFAFFKLKDKDAAKGQRDLAGLLMSRNSRKHLTCTKARFQRARVWI